MIIFLCLLLYRDLVSYGGFLNDMITLFALQSAVVICGSHNVNERCAKLRDFEKTYTTELSSISNSPTVFVNINLVDAAALLR